MPSRHRPMSAPVTRNGSTANPGLADATASFTGITLPLVSWLDAVVAPTGGPAWTTDLVLGDHSYFGTSSPAAVAGYPSVTVPAGYVHELPIGVSFIGI